MTTEVQLSDDHPLMIAWKQYCSTDEAKSVRRLAAHITVKAFTDEGVIRYAHPHLDGSLWAAFRAGFTSATKPAPVSAEPEPVAWQYRWKIDGEWVNWRISDASQAHPNLRDLEERPLFTSPPDLAAENARLKEEIEELRSFVSSFKLTCVESSFYKDCYLHIVEPNKASFRLGNGSQFSQLIAELEKLRSALADQKGDI